MLSADGARVGFAGIAFGSVYGAVADAECVHVRRHRCPARGCDCGFYCLHSVEAARALRCDPQYRDGVLLEVAASGRFIRYEHGLRYARQRVRAVRLDRWCGCGGEVAVLVDAGTGTVAWRQLLPQCAVCADGRPALTVDGFACLAGPAVEVTVDAPPPGRLPAGWTPGSGDEQLVPVLAAEVALLQARLDDLQARLHRLSDPGR